METLFDIPILAFKDADAWKAWLKDNYADQRGVWIKIAKKDSGIRSINHAEALDEALCYGWIDGMRRANNETTFLQKFTPRRKRSIWSKINIGKVESLIAEGRMQAPGLEEFEAAMADGRLEAAYDSPKNALVPEDLLAALEQNVKAKQFFDSLNKTERYAVLWRLMTAKTPEMRKSRLEKILKLLETDQKV